MILPAKSKTARAAKNRAFGMSLPFRASANTLTAFDDNEHNRLNA